MCKCFESTQRNISLPLLDVIIALLLYCAVRAVRYWYAIVCLCVAILYALYVRYVSNRPLSPHTRSHTHTTHTLLCLQTRRSGPDTEDESVQRRKRQHTVGIAIVIGCAACVVTCLRIVTQVVVLLLTILSFCDTVSHRMDRTDSWRCTKIRS